MPLIRMPADMQREGLRAFHLVVGATNSGGIGHNGALPWKLPTDMKRFKEVTTAPSAKSVTGKSNAVIMGRKTWESIPEKFRPLADRVNIIVSTTLKEAPAAGTHVAPSLRAALDLCVSPSLLSTIDRVFVIGGTSLFAEALDATSEVGQHLASIYLTRVEKDYECNVVVPELAEGAAFSNRFHLETAATSAQDEDTPMRFERWIANNCEERQYLDLVRRILQSGVTKSDRTGVGTRSIFGNQMRFDLSGGRFPLLTTKRVFWRGVCEELLWFIRGDTNAKHLQDKDIHIWDGNASREYLDSIGLGHREVGDLGPVYGFQWRHYAAQYETCHSDYEGKGVDQLNNVIETLRKNPNDRRIIMSAWNPPALTDMALPPCHVMCQFYVAEGKLSCMMYQRSCDMGLGVPFNIASYALLTILIARATGLKPGEFIHTLGDTHVYLNHQDPLVQQLERDPRPFPYLHVKQDRATLEEYQFEDFELLDYHPYPTIKMEMAV
eukprot:PhM_4_TR19075/c0_g1_i1/m.716/K13998/DHFR-TS; dihydrofolate reductase / thymidylate synthase